MQELAAHPAARYAGPLLVETDNLQEKGNRVEIWKDYGQRKVVSTYFSHLLNGGIGLHDIIERQLILLVGAIEVTPSGYFPQD